MQPFTGEYRAASATALLHQGEVLLLLLHGTSTDSTGKVFFYSFKV